MSTQSHGKSVRCWRSCTEYASDDSNKWQKCGTHLYRTDLYSAFRRTFMVHLERLTDCSCRWWLVSDWPHVLADQWFASHNTTMNCCHSLFSISQPPNAAEWQELTQQHKGSSSHFNNAVAIATVQLTLQPHSNPTMQGLVLTKPQQPSQGLKDSSQLNEATTAAKMLK